MEPWLRCAGNCSRSSSLDEFAVAGAWEERFLVAEGGTFRSERTSISLDNKEAEEY